MWHRSGIELDASSDIEVQKGKTNRKIDFVFLFFLHFLLFLNTWMCTTKGSMVGRTRRGTYDEQDALYNVQDALYDIQDAMYAVHDGSKRCQ